MPSSGLGAFSAFSYSILRTHEEGSVEVCYFEAKTRLGADCGSDDELLIAKFRLKLKTVGKTTRPFRYDLNQIPYRDEPRGWGHRPNAPDSPVRS